MWLILCLCYILCLSFPGACGCPCDLRFKNLYCKKPGSVSNFPEDILGRCSRLVIIPAEIRGKWFTCTGWPKSKFEMSFGYNSEMRLKIVHFFYFYLFVYNYQLFVYNFSKKLFASQTHFGFTKMGSEVHSFRVIAKRHFKFWFG